jgi:hypothetical protein
VIAAELAARRLPAMRSAALRAALIVVAAATYAALLAVLTWQALRGQSVVHPDGLTLTAIGAIAVGAIGSTIVVVRRRWPDPAVPLRRTSIGATR